jgi:hypothetical protein
MLSARPACSVADANRSWTVCGPVRVKVEQLHADALSLVGI